MVRGVHQRPCGGPLSPSSHKLMISIYSLLHILRFCYSALLFYLDISQSCAHSDASFHRQWACDNGSPYPVKSLKLTWRHGLHMGRNAFRTCNKAILSELAVITGSWLAFRAQSRNKNDILISERDKRTMIEGETGEDRIARAPLTEKRTKP